MKSEIKKMISNLSQKAALLLIAMALTLSSVHAAEEGPAQLIESKVGSLLGAFVDNKQDLENDRKALFDLVDNIASPLFDFNYISKLVLAKSWKSASEQQRQAFATEFKRLLIVTYATALFRYTGNEAMEFGATKIKEKKAAKFATVNTEVSINDGPSIPVVYSMILEPESSWKIYNLTVGDLNMVLNYRNVIQSTIHSDGLDSLITSMKTNNDKNYN